MASVPTFVMPVLDTGILFDLTVRQEEKDGRIKSGHDDGGPGEVSYALP